MDALEQLSKVIPDVARDIRLNLQAVLRGGALTDGGAARTICLVLQPAAPKAAAKRSTKSARRCILCIPDGSCARISRARQRRLHLAS